MTAPPKTVLYVAWAPFLSGAERALLLLARHMDRRRYRPVVLLGTDGPLRRALDDADIETVIVPVRRTSLRHPVAWMRSVAGVVRASLRWRPALLHANDVLSFQPAGYAGRLLGLPATVHVRFLDTTGPSLRWFLKPHFTRAVFISRAIRTEATALLPGFFDERSSVIYDGVVVPPLPAEADVERMRASLGLAPGRPAVLLSGQIAHIKGIVEYIDAARLLVERGSDATFAVVGEDLRHQGRIRLEAMERVRALGLQDRVTFYGYRDDAAQLASAFDVVAVPSHVEPLGLSALEAMALARPVVASAVGGLAETVVDEQTGLLVAPKDAHALAGALGRLLADPSSARALGVAARARVEREFSAAAHCTAMAEFYDEVLATGTRATRRDVPA